MRFYESRLESHPKIVHFDSKNPRDFGEIRWNRKAILHDSTLKIQKIPRIAWRFYAWFHDSTHDSTLDSTRSLDRYAFCEIAWHIHIIA